MGLLQNRKNEDEDVAREMLELGLDIEQISQITGLSVEEIEKLEKMSENVRINLYNSNDRSVFFNF